MDIIKNLKIKDITNTVLATNIFSCNHAVENCNRTMPSFIKEN